MPFLNQAKVECPEIAIIANSQKTHEDLCRRAALRREIELTTVPLETARAAPEPQHGSFSDCSCTAGIFGYQGPQDFAVPGLGVLHIENGMEREIVSLLCGHSEPAQAAIDVAGAGRCRHLDDAERTDGLKCIATVARQADHHVS